MARTALPAILLALLAVPLVPADAEPAPRPLLSEIVADPLGDWNGDGRITPSDEYVEILNPSGAQIDLGGWRLLLNDTTPAVAEVVARLAPGERWVLQNPPGEINNNGHVALLDAAGTIVDEVRFGSWAGAGETPSADATNELDEALARVGGAWAKTHATPGLGNDEPRWELAASWEPPPIRGWLGPNATGNLSARAVHAGEAYDELALWALDAGSAAPRRVAAMAGSGPAEAALSAPASFAYWWTADPSGTVRESPRTEVRVDGDPPVVDAWPAREWLNASASSWLLPDAQDVGAGGVEWQWRDASGPGATSEWLATRAVPVGNWTERSAHVLQARARDALGNEAAWGSSHTLRVDRTPPAPPEALRVDEGPPFRLRWEPASDNGSGVAAYEVRRVHAGDPRTWTVGNDTLAAEDAFDAGRGPLAYEVRALDAAGNGGNASRVDVDHAGLHPAVVAIRILKPYWGSGTQEIRVDFDRPMNTSRAPTLHAGPAQGPFAEARWLANGTTYWVPLRDATARAEGAQVVRVTEAWDAQGSGMRLDAAARFVVDRTPPIARVDAAPGWTNRSGANASVADANPSIVGWRLWAEGEPEPSAWNETGPGPFVVGFPGQGNWTLRVAARDAAGNDAPSVRLVVRVDREAPTWSTPAEPLAADARVGVGDARSGLNWSSLGAELPPGWSVRGDPARGAVLVLADASARDGAGRVWVEDRAGNRAGVVVNLTAAGAASSLEAPPPSPGSSGAGSRALENLAAAAEGADSGGFRSWSGLWTLPVLGTLAAVVPWARRRRRKRRRRRPVASLAARIRSARAAEGQAAPLGPRGARPRAGPDAR